MARKNATRSSQRAKLNIDTSEVKISKSKIHGNIHIVVYNQKKADISILKY